METIDLFTTLSEDNRQALLRGAVHHAFRKGDQLVEKGQAVSGAYFVSQGMLRVFALAPSGRETTLYLIRPGETCVLALNSLFNNLLYPAWVEADMDTDVTVVPGALYRRLFATEAAVQDLTVHALSTVVLRLMSEIEASHSLRVDQRLASFLLNQAHTDGMVRKTQAELAAHIGTSREVVARAVSSFARAGWVESGRGHIHLKDTHALAALIGDGAPTVTDGS